MEPLYRSQDVYAVFDRFMRLLLLPIKALNLVVETLLSLLILGLVAGGFALWYGIIPDRVVMDVIMAIGERIFELIDMFSVL